jgi:hypothetical protein
MVQKLEKSNEALHAENAERIRAEAAFRSAQANLARLARLPMMNELAASIAHEVNQPLMAVVTNAETCLRWLAQDPPDLDEARQAAERTAGAGHRAADIIRTIRKLVRKSTPEMTRFDVNTAIADVLTLTRGEQQRYDVVVETELSAGLEPILGDRGQVQQVILNLIVNGIEAMAANTHHPRVLRISSRRAGPGDILSPWRIQVRGSRQRRWTGFSMPSSRQSPREWEWGCRSAARSLKRMAAPVGITKSASGQHLSVHCTGGGRRGLAQQGLKPQCRIIRLRRWSPSSTTILIYVRPSAGSSDRWVWVSSCLARFRNFSAPPGSISPDA